uniref:UMA domain-containing protein n=1 Tax=Anopheles atroparvus TaxID=41427 RepID=A0A182ITF8_ANOAO
MFSFFKSKKPSPTQIPGEPIPGAAPVPDDFIFIERRDSSPKPAGGGGAQSSTASSGDHGLYPAIPDTDTKDPAKSATTTRQRSEEKVNHALSGVPFKLAPELCLDTRNEVTRIQINDIMSFVARTLYTPQYDFSVERSVLNE